MAVYDAQPWTAETLGPLWDDLYLLVPVYMVCVAALRRVGPWRVSETQSKSYKFNAAFWKPIMIAYNVAMTLFSFVCFAGMAYVVLVKQQGEFAGPDCQAYDRQPLFRNIVYAFFVSKFVEFADTLFLIVKGKPVSWLHFFHHCGAAINMGLLSRSGMEATWLFVLLNGFVHTVMYTYYGCALAGVRLRGKSLITVMQIAQFLLGLSVFWQYKNVTCFSQSAPLMFTFWYTYTYVGIVLLFFLNFFAQSYVMPRKTKADQLKSQ